jgi:hypothetical protein
LKDKKEKENNAYVFKLVPQAVSEVLWTSSSETRFDDS